MNTKPVVGTPHEQALSLLESMIISRIGDNPLNANRTCNECGDLDTFDLVEGIVEVRRNKSVGNVRPDLSLWDSDGNLRLMIEVVDTHAPDNPVYTHALSHGIDVVEFHLASRKRDYLVRRKRTPAHEKALNTKTRLQDFADGRLEIDAHTFQCARPKCDECLTPLPRREISTETRECWKCEKPVVIAKGAIDGNSLWQDNFTDDELAWVREQGVKLERRYSFTIRDRYLANVCTNCDQIQGDYYLYVDEYHTGFIVKEQTRSEFGPCTPCATEYCKPCQSEYFSYGGQRNCLRCENAANRVMCPHNTDRECLFPNKCDSEKCYWLNRWERESAPITEQIEEDAYETRSVDAYTLRLRPDWNPTTYNPRDDRGNSMNQSGEVHFESNKYPMDG